MNDRIKKEIENAAEEFVESKQFRTEEKDQSRRHCFVQGAEWMLNSELMHDRMILFAGYLQGKQSIGITNVSVIMKEFKKDFNID